MFQGAFMRDAIRTMIFLVAVLVVGSGEQALPQTTSVTHSVSGVVLDTSGAAIVGADVTLTQHEAAISQTRTDNAGSFHFDDLKPGDYQLAVQHPGFRQTTLSVTLSSGPIANVHIVLPVFVES